MQLPGTIAIRNRLFCVCPDGEPLGPPVAWILLFCAFFSIFYCLHGDRISPDPRSAARFDLMTGDEPHYLLLTHSLALDGDLNLLNNFEQRDYRIFYSGAMPDYRGGFASFWKKIARGRLKNVPDEYWQQHLYSMCSPGLPTLLAPAYAVGYYWEQRVRFVVAVFMHALTALLGLLTVWLAWRVCRVRFWGLLIGVSLLCSGPLIFYSMSVYTDLPGALCMTSCFVLLWRWPPTSRRSQFLSLAGLGALMGFMVWLHTKFWMPFFYLTATMLWVLWRSSGPRPNLLAWIIPATLFLASIATYYWLIFGVPFPVRTYPPFVWSKALISGWPGLWLDQRNGLLWYMPLALFIFPGMVVLFRTRSGLGGWVCGLILAHWIGTGLFSDWTGGRCPPMRYWVPVAPLFAVPLAAWIKSPQSPWVRALFVLAALSGVFVGFFGMLHPRRLYAYTHPIFSYWLGDRFGKNAPCFDAAWLHQNTLWLGAVALLVAALSWWSFRSSSREQAVERSS